MGERFDSSRSMKWLAYNYIYIQGKNRSRSRVNQDGRGVKKISSYRKVRVDRTMRTGKKAEINNK